MTEERIMTIDEFRTLLDRRGGNPARWPADEEQAAKALLATSDEAQTLLRSAVTLDAVLDSVRAAPVSDALRERVLTLPLPAAQRTQTAAASWRSRLAVMVSEFIVAIFRPAVAGAAVAGLAAGFALSTSMMAPDDQQQTTIEIVSDQPAQLTTGQPVANAGASENLTLAVASLSGGYAPDLSVTDTIDDTNGEGTLGGLNLY